MNFLLDTHILIWSLIEPKRLHRRVKDVLDSSDTQIWLSPITTWECLVLAEKGKVTLPPDPVTWVQKALINTGSREAMLNHAIAEMSRTIDLPHQDPADRFLAATAAVYGLTLVTSDSKILQGKGFSTLSNI